MKVVFLDIDGVLNNHAWNECSESCTIDFECVHRFNQLLELTGAKVILSSAWRYIVLNNEMTLKGFGYMLRAFGVSKSIEIVDVCPPDEVLQPGETGNFAP